MLYKNNPNNMLQLDCSLLILPVVTHHAKPLFCLISTVSADCDDSENRSSDELKYIIVARETFLSSDHRERKL